MIGCSSTSRVRKASASIRALSSDLSPEHGIVRVRFPRGAEIRVASQKDSKVRAHYQSRKVSTKGAKAGWPCRRTQQHLQCQKEIATLHLCHSVPWGAKRSGFHSVAHRQVVQVATATVGKRQCAGHAPRSTHPLSPFLVATSSFGSRFTRNLPRRSWTEYLCFATGGSKLDATLVASAWPLHSTASGGPRPSPVYHDRRMAFMAILRAPCKRHPLGQPLRDKFQNKVRNLHGLSLLRVRLSHAEETGRYRDIKPLHPVADGI